MDTKGIYKKILPHLVLWFVAAIGTFFCRSYIFHIALLLWIVDIIWLLIAGRKFERMLHIFCFIIVPVAGLILGFLRAAGKILLFVMISLTFCSLYAQSEEFLLRKADAVNYDKGDYNLAAERYWQAAERYGSFIAVEKLSELYSGKRWFRNNIGFDWSVVSKYIQDTADRFYPPESAIASDTDFVIIASEGAIIGQAVWNLEHQEFPEKQGLYDVKKFKKGLLVGAAIDIVKKDLKINGKKGLFVARSRWFDGIGFAALVDRKTASEQFDFTAPPSWQWTVYVRCPTNKNLLIPFDDFHRYVYQDKMRAFVDICRKLNAKSIRIYYKEGEKNNTEAKIAVKGGVDEYAQAQFQAEIAKEANTSETAKANYDFENVLMSVLRRPVSPWIDKEPTWRAMVDARLDVNSNLRKFNAQFTYNDSCSVDLKSALMFKAPGWNGGVQAGFKNEKFTSIVWEMEVEFYHALF